MFAEINISLFVFTIVLMSITWQNVPHHFHSEAALLIGEGYRVTHMIVFFIDPPPNHFRKAHYNYDNGKYYDKQCLLHNHYFLYVYYKNLRKNIIKNITKRIKPHPHARFDISFSKLDNSDVFFDLLPS